MELVRPAAFPVAPAPFLCYNLLIGKDTKQEGTHPVMKQKPVAPEPSPPTGLNTGERAVNQYTLDVSFVRTWPSMTAAAGVVYSSIRAACNGRIKTAGATSSAMRMILRRMGRFSGGRDPEAPAGRIHVKTK